MARRTREYETNFRDEARSDCLFANNKTAMQTIKLREC